MDAKTHENLGIALKGFEPCKFQGFKAPGVICIKKNQEAKEERRSLPSLPGQAFLELECI